MMALLDTDTCIDVLRGRPSLAPQKIMEAGIGQVCISAITYHELQVGLHKVKRTDRQIAFDEFMGVLSVLPFPPQAATKAALVRVQLEERGESIGVLDAMIAGHALWCDLKLITANARHFGRIEGLVLENWRIEGH